MPSAPNGTTPFCVQTLNTCKAIIRRKQWRTRIKFRRKRYEGPKKIRRKNAGIHEHDEDLQDLHLQISRKNQHVQNYKSSMATCRSNIIQQESTTISSRKQHTCTDRMKQESSSKIQTNISHSIWHGFQWFKA